MIVNFGSFQRMSLQWFHSVCLDSSHFWEMSSIHSPSSTASVSHVTEHIVYLHANASLRHSLTSWSHSLLATSCCRARADKDGWKSDGEEDRRTRECEEKGRRKRMKSERQKQESSGEWVTHDYRQHLYIQMCIFIAFHWQDILGCACALMQSKDADFSSSS